MATKRGKKTKADFENERDEVMRLANGRWESILPHFDFPADCLDGRHHPCPKCGGTDRFRFTDMNGDGSCICNQCMRDVGNGLDAAISRTGNKFWDVFKRLAEIVGYTLTCKVQRLPDDDLEFLPWNEGLVALWCLKKSNNRSEPFVITPAAVQAAGGCRARYKKQYTVIALPVWGEMLDAAKPVGWSLYNITGGSLPRYEVNKTTNKPEVVEWLKVKLTAGSRPGVICDLSRVRSVSVLWKTEGGTDLLAFNSLPDLPDNVAGITNANGCSETPAEWMLNLFADKLARVVHDADRPGQNGAVTYTDPLGRERPGWSNHIATKASECRNVVLPYAIEDKHGKDLRDFIFEGHSYSDIAAIADQSAIIQNENLSLEKPKVIIGVDEDRVIDEAIVALGMDNRVFRRGSMLVSIIRDTDRPKGIVRPPNSPRISPLPLPIIRERLAANINWMNIKIIDGEAEEVPTHPPMWAVNAVSSRGEWYGIRRLEGVIESPVIRHDGTVLDQAGYDAVTGLYYEPNAELPPLNANPTIDDARKAVEALSEVVVDFPFEKDTHRSAWFASVLTPFARFAYEGPTPLFLVEANTPGTGKGLLCDTIGHIAIGREMSRMSYPSDDDEMRKNITATAMAGDRTVLIDNVSGNFGSPALDAMLTASTWRDRMLGKSETTGDIPLTTVWYATGNNLVLIGDIARRICPIRILSPLEKPEERTNFHHADLIGWVRQHRGRLMHACLTILSAYIESGRPNQGLTSWGSYTGWSNLVRSAIVWAGLGDPAISKSELRSQSDRGVGLLRMIIDGLAEYDKHGSGVTVSEMLKVFEFEEGSFDLLKTALLEIGGKKNLTTQKIGMKLHHIKGRVAGGKYIERINDKITRWLVVDVEEKKQDSKIETAKTEKQNHRQLFKENSVDILDSLP